MSARALRALLAVLLAGVTGIGASAASSAAPADPPTRILFVAAPGASNLVHGTYPVVPSPCRDPVRPFLHARYPGTLEVGRDTDGSLYVIDVLPLEEYLDGIAEMPPTWDLAALKAQAVAARSYALANLGGGADGERLGYDLCATAACQVYRGLGPADGPYGDRWAKAVSTTADQVLLADGRPADTVYFSTSNGMTLGNHAVFGSAPLPYLKPIVEKDDGASPLSHWQAVLAVSDVHRFLSAAGARSAAVTKVSRSGDTIVVTGGGTTTNLPVATFRDDMNAWAHCLDPASYPSVDAGSRLPQTVPSVWFDVATEGSSVVLTGRGWGHGVGMVQWGAQGKAERGLTYRQILAAYYGGLRPTKYDEPTTVRILVASGLESLQVQPTGEVTVEGATVDPGPWKVTADPKLAIGPSGPLPSYVPAGRILASPHSLRPGHSAKVKVDIPELTVLSLVVRGHGPDVTVAGPFTEQPGRTTVAIHLPGSLPGGSYRLVALTTDGTDVAASPPHRLAVPAPPRSPTPSPTASPLASPTSLPQALPTPSNGRGVPAGPVLAGVLGLVAVAAGLLLWRRRRARRPAT